MGWGTAAQAGCSRIAIDGGALDDALIGLARQTGTDIATTERGLHQVRARPVSGCLTVQQALAHLVRGSNYRVVAAGQGGYRIVRAKATPSEQSPVAAPETASAPQPTDIIVTGTKQQVALLRFPGSVQIVDAREFSEGIARAATLDDVARMSPIMQKTELGVGRDKLFIRGISDSSFNGPTQSTATLYFGDVQLNYSGPQPALHLADMERIEILEGPQETLYGSGAISGIIRMTPHAVDLDRIGAFATGGGTFTRTGAPGFDTSAMLNIPLVDDRAGVRLVGYRTRDGGYIDDTLRHVNNVNRTDTIGGRGAFLVEPGDGWSLDASMLAQRIDAADAGYAETINGPESRHSFLAQPYTSSIVLWRGVIRKQWDSGLEMVSATGIVNTLGHDTFDATRLFPGLGPTIYQVNSDGLQVSHETRFTRKTGGVSWVVGLALLYDRDAEGRVIGSPADPIDIIGVTNTTRSASAFGEATIPLTKRLSITAGARATIAQTQGEPSLTPSVEPSESGFPLRRVQPAVAISWLVAPHFAAFARFQTGYRTGGIAVARGVGRVENFNPDAITVGEAGVRHERSGRRGVAFSAAVSLARWAEIQADLYSRFSQPYTSNIGDATIVAVEANGDWIPLEGLKASFAMLWTQNRTSGALAGTSPVENRHLPDTPPFSGNLSLEYGWSWAGGHSFGVGGAVRYIGRSVLGTGNFLDLSQGNYATASLVMTWHWRNLEASANLDNLTNESASQFAMGNPLTFGFREQTVPLRPRNVRLGLGVHW